MSLTMCVWFSWCGLLCCDVLIDEPFGTLSTQLYTQSHPLTPHTNMYKQRCTRTLLLTAILLPVADFFACLTASPLLAPPPPPPPTPTLLDTGLLACCKAIFFLGGGRPPGVSPPTGTKWRGQWLSSERMSKTGSLHCVSESLSMAEQLR